MKKIEDLAAAAEKLAADIRSERENHLNDNTAASHLMSAANDVSGGLRELRLVLDAKKETSDAKKG